MLQAFIVALSLLPWIPAVTCRVITEGEISIMEGQSLTVPCHYEPQYTSYVKYWCRGQMREFCTTLARTDEPRSADPAQDSVSIFDDPVQQVFTVTMNNLKEGDSGWYMCGVEIGGMWSADDVAYTNIKVIHGMSVVNNRLVGEEGSSVTAECQYSERYKEIEKKWCRSGDWSSCVQTGSEGSYEDTSVAIRDDRSRTFTVTFKKLQMKDAGWYWCSAGQQKRAVQVLVTPRLSTTAASVTSTPTPSQSAAHLPPPRPIAKESWNSHSQSLETLLVCSTVIIFLMGLAILARKRWKRHRRDAVLRRAIKAKHNDYSVDVDESATVVFLNRDSQEIHMY